MGIAVGHNGNIYVADSGNDRIQCFTSEGKFMYKWGCNGKRDGEFNSPRGLCVGVSRQGKIKSNAIIKAMFSVPALSLFPPGILPMCVSYIGVQRLYVVDSDNDRIQVFGFDTKISSNGFVGQQLCYKQANLPSAEIFPGSNSEYGSSTLSEDVKFIGSWGSYGKGDGQFNSPHSCTIGYSMVDESSVLYVTDTWNHRVQVFSTKGKFIRKLGTDCYDMFRLPRGITTSRNCFTGFAKPLDVNYELAETLDFGHESAESSDVRSHLIYIVDMDGSSIVCYNVDRISIHKWSLSDSMAIGINNINNIMVDDSGDGIMIYVADRFGYCINQFQIDGSKNMKFIRKFGGYGGNIDQFKSIQDMARGPNGVMYIVDKFNHRVAMNKM